MTLPTTDEAADMHQRQVTAIMNATAKLLLRFGPDGFTPEAIFEGAVKGAIAQMIAGTGCGTREVAAMLDDMSDALKEIREVSHAAH